MKKGISHLDFLEIASIALRVGDYLPNPSSNNRIKAGIYFSKTKTGKFWIKTIPYGYKKLWTEGNFHLVPEKTGAAVIKAIYTLFLENTPLQDILAVVQRAGRPLKGINALKRILVNPLYSGFQYVSAVGELPGGYFPANIPRIVTYEDWQEAQRKLITQNIIKSERI